jgi:uncharacterized membrane protein YesL
VSRRSEQARAEPPPRRGELIDKATTFILVNMLWMVLAAPIVTLPPATAGLFATLTPWVRGQHSEPFRDFFGAMRRYALQSLAIVLADVVIGLVIWLNFGILRQMGTSVPAVISLSATIFVTLAAVAANLYLWPLLVSVDAPLKQIVRAAVRLVLLRPAWSIFASLIALLPLLVSLTLPRFIALLLPFSTCALLASWGAWRVLRSFVDNRTLKGI